MPAPTLIYLHGFRSSPASIKAQIFVHRVAALPDAIRPRLVVPALSHEPAAAVAAVAAWIEREVRVPAHELTIVGSSLGGYYATSLAETFGARAVLINPAIRPYEQLEPFIGTQRNLYTNDTWQLTRAHFADLARWRVAHITRPQRYFLLMRSGDDLIDWREAVVHYAGAWQFVAAGGTHGWEDIDDELPSILRFAGCANSR